MRRREFITLFGGSGRRMAALGTRTGNGAYDHRGFDRAVDRQLRAQYLGPSQGLEENGYVEGSKLLIEYR